MMLFIALCILLLIVTIMVFAYSGRGRKSTSIVKLNEINTTYYQQRVAEISQDQQLGFIDNSLNLTKELQQTLLDDIPDKTIAKPTSLTDKNVNRILFIGSLLIVLVSSVIYFAIGGSKQVQHLQNVRGQLNQLNEQYYTNTLPEQDWSNYVLGLRDWLFTYPDRADGWLIFGEVNQTMGNMTNAKKAFYQAYKLTPNDSDAMFNYGNILLYSSRAQDVHTGVMLLNQAADNSHIKAIRTLAFLAQEQSDNAQAISYWQRWLALVDKDEPNRLLIEKTIEILKENDL